MSEDLEANGPHAADSEGAPSTNGTEDGSPASEASHQIWEEMDLPWPATFERSISLLASVRLLFS